MGNRTKANPTGAPYHACFNQKRINLGAKHVVPKLHDGYRGTRQVDLRTANNRIRIGSKCPKTIGKKVLAAPRVVRRRTCVVVPLKGRRRYPCIAHIWVCDPAAHVAAWASCRRPRCKKNLIKILHPWNRGGRTAGGGIAKIRAPGAFAAVDAAVAHIKVVACRTREATRRIGTSGKPWAEGTASRNESQWAVL